MELAQAGATLLAGGITGIVTGVVSARVAIARFDVHLVYLREDVRTAKSLGREANTRLDKIGAPAV